ncbi:TPA: conjugal transfer protein TraF [Citrobacter freundii]|uniref:conjugal transfer protein TraF n=1 Tax=Citrobacter freundii TaxID=546 RepID=UPI003890C8EE|nr:conjugal transfer protein TraF [Citrobacter freundii]
MKYQFLTKIIIPLLVGFAFSTSVLADEVNTPTSQSPQTTSDDLAGGQAFLNGKEEGWFWRKSPPEPVKKKPVKLPPPPTLPPQETPKQVAQTPMESTPEPAATEKPGPAPFTVAWFNENIQKLRNQAIDNPTQENVRAYFLAQRIMLDKASRFTDMARLVTSTDPLIDENSRRSTSTFGAMDQSNEAENNSRTVIKDVATKAGLFFFFRGENCSICVKQASVMNTFSFMTDMKVIPISLDGKPLPGNIYPDWRPDSGQASKLQISNAPAIALAIPPSTTRIVSFGPISADQLISRTVLIAHDAGIISDQQYKSTLPYNDTGYIDSNILNDMPKDLTQQPDEFIKYIQAKAGYGSTPNPNANNPGEK